MQFEKKEILYRIMKRKIKSNILFFLVFDTKSLAFIGDIDFNQSIIMKIQDYFTCNDISNSYFSIDEFFDYINIKNNKNL